MNWQSLADAVLVAHLAFIAFVVLGGLAVACWPRVAWAHLPAVAWGAGISFAGAICPLTPLENSLRQRAGEAGYEGGFVEHYLLAIVYPDGLTREVQVALGIGVLLLNLAAYGWAIRRSRRAS